MLSEEEVRTQEPQKIKETTREAPTPNVGLKQITPSEDTVRRINALFARAAERHARPDGRVTLTEPEAYEVLTALGVSVPAHGVASSPKDLPAIISTIPGKEVVLKIVSPDTVHKSDVGGVRVGVPKNRKAVSEAYDAMLREVKEKAPDATIEGVLIAEQPALGEPDTRQFRELLVGITLNPEFGPILMFGRGGKYTETFKDVARRMTPLTTRDAQELVRETPLSGPLLESARGRPPIADEDELIGMLCRLGRVAEKQAHTPSPYVIENLDINPLAITPDRRLIALDASITIAPRDRSAYRPHDISVDGMDAVLSPKRVAMVGASSDTTKLGGVIFKAICDGDVEAVAINPKAAGDGVRIQGRETYASVSELPEPVDVVVVAVPAEACTRVVSEIASSGKARAAILIPGGFGEVDSGRKLSSQLEEAIEGSNVRINGPNCMGLYSALGGSEYNCFFIGPDTMLIPRREKKNPVALVSQSGGLISTELCHLETAAGCSAVVSIGNQLDLGPVEYLSYLRKQPEIDVLAFYIESFKPGDGRLFAEEAAKAKNGGKTVIVYKSGKTEEGTKATAGHTARMAGEWDVAAAALKQSGVWVTESLEEFDDAVRIAGLMVGKKVRGRRTGVTSICGSECVITADTKGRLELPQFSPEETTEIRRNIPNFLDVRNPLDLSGGINSEQMLAVIEALLSSPNYDNVVVGLLPHLPGIFIRRDDSTRLGRSLVETLVEARSRRPGASLAEIAGDEKLKPILNEAMTLKPNDLEDPRSIIPGIIALHEKYPDKPLIFSVSGSWRNYGSTIEQLEAAGIPCFTHMERAVKALDRYLNNRLGGE